MITNKILSDFKRKTNYPLGDFFIEAKLFFEKDYNNFVLFFSGKTNLLDKTSIKRLNKLSEQSLVISNLFLYKKNLMKTIDYWELLEGFENIKTKLETTINISKYSRSSVIANQSKSGFAFDYNLVSEQTLENVSRTILKESSFENDWINIAMDNDLKEIDYDISGGNPIKLRKKLLQANLVTSMIDNTIGEKIYGRDIKRFFSYKDDDLESLGYKETAFQTSEILSQLENGDIPEFPELGLNPQFYKGVNTSQLNYPSIIREIKRNFSTDDLFVGFEIKSIKLDHDDIQIEYKVETKYELVIIKNITI
jgi:hypothetical protein